MPAKDEVPGRGANGGTAADAAGRRARARKSDRSGCHEPPERYRPGPEEARQVSNKCN